jgi:hypothetical protein
LRKVKELKLRKQQMTSCYYLRNHSLTVGLLSLIYCILFKIIGDCYKYAENEQIMEKTRFISIIGQFSLDDNAKTKSKLETKEDIILKHKIDDTTQKILNRQRGDRQPKDTISKEIGSPGISFEKKVKK